MIETTRSETVPRYWRPGLYIRAVLFWVPFALSIGVYAPVVLASALMPISWRYRIVYTWNGVNIWFLKVICGVTYKVHGMENLPLDTAAVILCKHQSTWETLALNLVIRDRLVWVLKRELTYIPLFGWGLAVMNPIAIDRASGRDAVQQVVQQGLERLSRGLWVVVFPEGTRGKPGKKLRYKLGGAILAANAGVPVVPIAHNAGDYWPRHSLIKWPGEIQMYIGPAIDTRGLAADEITRQAEEWIEGKMAEVTCLDRFPY